jgi:rhamnosyltransferase subunit B
LRVLIVTLGSIGDLMPFLVVADRLRARGHQCLIASNAGYASLVQASGFPFAAIWERGTQSLDEALAHDTGTAWNQVRDHMLLPAAEPTLRCIAHFARQAPGVVLASWSAFGAHQAHRQLGVPLASAYLSPHALTLPQAADDPGVKLGLFPDWFAAAPPEIRSTGFPMHDDAAIPPLPPALETFLQQAAPPVVLTPGSFMRNAAGFFRAGLAACEQLGLRAVLLTPHADQAPALPAWARHYSYINLQRLLPRCTAILHHGGIGTAAQGLRAGVPQLLAPVFFDQFDNAARLEALGVGTRMAALDAVEIAAALQALLPAPAACAALSARFARADAAADVCDMLEALNAPS